MGMKFDRVQIPMEAGALHMERRLFGEEARSSKTGGALVCAR